MVTDIYLKEGEINFLIITSRDFSWVSDLQEIADNIDIIQTEKDLLTTLTENNYHIIFYDDNVFKYPAPNVVDEITQQVTSAVISVITDEETEPYYNELLLAGASDIIPTDIAVSDLVQRIAPMLHQSYKNSVLAERTRKLHAINSLSHKLHNAEHPTTLIVEAVDWICNYFDIYGVAITLDKGSNLHLYAGTHSISGQQRIYESTAPMKEYDPLFHVITSNISLIIADITKHPEFVPIPIIQKPKSAIIVPLVQGFQTMGSIAFFANEDVIFTSDDLATFELLANHFLSAYINVRDYVGREADVQAMRQVLKAWSTLNNAYSANDIVTHLYKFIQETASAQNVAIWLFNPDNSIKQGTFYSASAKTQQALQDLNNTEEELQSLISEFDGGMQPVTFHKRLVKTEAILKLYNALASNQITIVPIAGSRFEGMVFIGSKFNQTVSNADLSLVENLVRVAANVLERNILIDELQNQTNRLQEQTGRIEGVVRSIREGIFFVQENGEVVYSNPQFTELTNISSSTVLSKDHTELFRQLSEKSSERQQTLTQLNQAFEQVLNLDDYENYPIVEIRNIPDTNILIEFMRVDNSPNQKSWIGVVRSNDQQNHVVQASERSELLQDMLEDIGIPLATLNKTTMMLPEQQNYLNPQKFGNMLEDVDYQVQNIQAMWSNYLQIYRGETSGIAIHESSVDVEEFISDLLTTRRMFAYHRQIRFSKTPIQSTIKLDERLMRQSIINLIDFMVTISNHGAPIFVGMETEGNKLVINLHEKTTFVPEDIVTSILEPTQSGTINHDVIRYRLGIYLAKQIIDAHGGNLSIVSGRGLGITVKIQLPSADAQIAIIPEEPQVSYTETPKSLNFVVLQSESEYLAPMYPILEDEEGHTILVERRMDDILMDISTMKTDVIVLEADRAPSALMVHCQSIRAQSEVPIIIIAARELEADCLQSLGLGADDYFLAPLQQEKLLAKLNSLAKRHEIVSRTSEPIIVGDLTIDFSRRRVMLKDKLLNLTTKEYDLLRVLAMNRGHVITHQQLLSKVWGPEYRDENQYLWVNISRLRRKLKPKKGDHQYIHNEQGVGYIFEYEADYKSNSA